MPRNSKSRKGRESIFVKEVSKNDKRRFKDFKKPPQPTSNSDSQNRSDDAPQNQTEPQVADPGRRVKGFDNIPEKHKHVISRKRSKKFSAEDLYEGFSYDSDILEIEDSEYQPAEIDFKSSHQGVHGLVEGANNGWDNASASNTIQSMPSTDAKINMQENKTNNMLKVENAYLKAKVANFEMKEARKEKLISSFSDGDMPQSSGGEDCWQKICRITNHNMYTVCRLNEKITQTILKNNGMGQNAMDARNEDVGYIFINENKKLDVKQLFEENLEQKRYF